MTEPADSCALCGLRPSALVHNATANGHDWSATVPPLGE